MLKNIGLIIFILISDDWVPPILGIGITLYVLYTWV